MKIETTDCDGDIIPNEGVALYPKGSDWSDVDYLALKLKKYKEWKKDNLELYENLYKPPS